MEKLTTEQKLEIMREAKKLYLANDNIFHRYICICLRDVINKGKVYKGDLFRTDDHLPKMFPELVDYKPEGINLGYSWWPSEDTVTRLRVFDQLIFNYEREIAMRKPRKPETWYTKLLNQIKSIFSWKS